MSNLVKGVAGIVYCATNTVNGKKYVGITSKVLGERRQQHKRDAESGSNLAFHRAIRKYGWDVFKWMILDEAKTRKELNEKEIQWIEKFNTYKGEGYNSTVGGDHLPENKGENNPNASITEQCAQEIGDLIINSDLSLKEIAEKFNVNKHIVEFISIGRAWGYLFDEPPSTTRARRTGKRSITQTITDKQAMEIGNLIIDSDLSLKEIAEKFNVSSYTVNKISTGFTWKHLFREAPGAIRAKRKGKVTNNQKITVAQAKEIGNLIINGGMSLKEIAENLSISRDIVRNISRGKSWSHLFPYPPGQLRRQRQATEGDAV